MAKYVSGTAEFHPWQLCQFCSMQTFKSSADFSKHLRERHCTKEGGSYVCRYGYNGVCPSLPLDGVSDRDYESHVTKYHVNIAAAKMPLPPTAEQWSIFSASQNLPAVLNDPSRGKQSNLFTKKWGDSFVEKVHISQSQHLSDINYEDFEPYMKKIGRRYRRHIRLTKSATNHLDNNQPTAANSSPLHSSAVNDSTIRQTTGGAVTLSELSDATLQDIPQIFLNQNLVLNNPNTFSQVFPGIGGGGVGAANDDADALDKHSSGRLLQEKLSHYLDIVEVQIAKQVSQKSSAFFNAMTSQDTIMEEMHAATANVRKLRNQIKSIDETVVKDSLTILSLERKRSNNHMLLRKLKIMATVHQTQPMIQLLLGAQDYVAAIDLISTTQDIVSQELVGIHCFKHLPSQLREMEVLIDKMLTTDFEKYLAADLNRPLIIISQANENGVILEEEKLVCIISGLLRQKNFHFIETYREEAIVTIKAVIKQLVIEVIASSDVEICLTGAGEESQSLSITEWVSLLETATGTLLKLLYRIRGVIDVMLKIAAASSGVALAEQTDLDGMEFIDSDAFLSESEYRKVDVKLKETMHTICNYCHERCANLISSQSLDRMVATPKQIEKLTDIVLHFSKVCENLSGSQSFPLISALKLLGTKFVQKFHSDRKSKLSLILDSERWKQADVPSEFQIMIDGIQREDFSDNDPNKEENQKEQLPSKVLLVDTVPYALVGSALILVRIVCEYCRCGTQLPIISTQLSRHVIDLLRTFNSRCCQLVLGAGALHMAGLKTITSGNLALVSRALQLVLWLLPHIKKHFQAIEQNGTSGGGAAAAALAGFDSVERDYVSHIKEIEGKILTIVEGVVNSQLSAWNGRPPVPSQSFRSISRHFVKLHEAIAPILPEQQVQTIYRTVHKTFKDKLRELVIKNNIVNNGGPQHGVVISELTFYMETLRTLHALPEAELKKDESLDDIWMK